MKWIVSALVVLATATAWAQQPKRFTLTANTQCASVSAQNNSTVGIIVSGTWSGTLTPNLRIAGVSGAPTASTTVTPSNSTTSQGTITGNGGFKSSVGGFTQFNLCFTSFSSGSAIIDLLPTTALNAGLLGGGSPAGAVTGTGLTSGNVISGAGGSSIQDSTIPAAQVVTANSPGVGLCHFAGSTQACTSSTVVNADITAATIDLTTKVTGVLPQANGGSIGMLYASACYGTVGTASGSVYGLSPASNTTACTSVIGASNESNVPVNCTAQKFYARATVGGALAGSGLVTLYKNNATTTLTCTIGTGNTQCSDLTHSVALTTADLWSVRVQTAQASDTTANVRVVFQCL